MADKEFEVKLPDELNYWAARVFMKVKKNFEDFYINRVAEGKGRGYTGDLYRKLWWTVHRAAGGNQALIQFFYMKYGDFVQWGVGGHVKKWPVPQLKGKDVEPIKHPRFNRSAKPFIQREMRYHLDWLSKRLTEQYGYMGNLYIVRGATNGTENREAMDKWISEHKKDLSEGFLKFANFT
ncbi:MAG: hypothetical protein IJA95_07385 [Bacteroidaceae bacterium]|nr:hypothetical protein [Bacteroidaceae bacterium]